MMRVEKKEFFARFASNERGQAALFDSIFFLTIVSIICTSLFFFAINYGNGMQKQLDSFYSTDFSADALKVINYVNVSRSGSSVVALPGGGTNEVVEYDYLLALIKEDYADKKMLSPETKKAVANTLNSVLKPFQESVDYAYYLLNDNQSNFLFLMLAIHECTGSDEECNSTNALNLDSAPVERSYYFCEPSDKKVLEREIYDFVKVDSTTGKVTLFEKLPGSNEYEGAGKTFLMGLDIWVTKNLDVLNNLDDKTKTPDFNCTKQEIAPPDPDAGWFP